LLPLVLAFSSTQTNIFVALMIVGAVVGVFGHIIHSRTLIIIGILTIALVSTYFEFFVAKID
jgi:hypothetical protein